MLISIVNLLLSPFCIMLFIVVTFGKESRFLVSSGTNVYRLKPRPYIIFSIIYVVFILSITQLWLMHFNPEMNLWVVYIPEYYWVSSLTWIVSIATILTYIKGMEGNIMGFIFFPMLLISMFALLGVNIGNVFSGDWQPHLPALRLNILVKLGLHAFLPYYLLLLLKFNQKEDEKKTNWFSTLIVSITIQLILFGVHWLVLYFFNKPISFFSYFGYQGSLLYFLPMFIGGVYYGIFFMSKLSFFKELSSKDKIIQAVIFVTYLSVLIQALNYLLLIRDSFEW